MAERRYSLRFSLPDGFLFVVSLLVASSLIFLFGVYVGKAGEMRKLGQPAPIIRVPVALAKETLVPARRQIEPPVLASVPVEKEPPEQIMPMFDAAPEEEAAKKPAVSLQPVKDTKKEKSAAKAKPAPTRNTASPPPTKASITTARDKRRSPSSVVAAAPKEKPKPAAGRWSVQVEETSSQAAAQNTVRVLRAQGHNPVMMKVMKGGEVRYRIRVGKFSNQQDAVGAVVNFRRGKFSKATMVSE